MKTIHELNAALTARRITGGRGYVYARELRLGHAGAQNARRGTAGAKLHLLDVDVVIEKPADGNYQIGALASVTGCTTSNGQFTGTVVPSAVDLDTVTCTRCKARLARLLATVEGSK